MFTKCKYALVLGGGGANGSYQGGVFKAFKKLKIKFNAIIGNSVGALNGALLAQNEINLVEKLWETTTIDQIISLPKELMKDGKLKLNFNNILSLKKLQEKIVKDKGLDSAPLEKLIKSYVKEEKIRKSKIDFGLVTYQIDNLKPIEIFLESIPEGQLYKYLLASASLPGFKITTIDGKSFIDGGVYDNIPYNMAKTRGYKNIIVIDVSGLGYNRKDDIIGTNTIYIKNSLELSNIVDFDPEKAKKFMLLGYLDTMRTFSKIMGVKYFYTIKGKDKKTILNLEEILYDKNTYKEYSNFLNTKKMESDKISIKSAINEILPKEYKNYMFLIPALAECLALSLNIERNQQYSFNELLNQIKNKYIELENKIREFTEDKSKFIFNNFLKKIKSGDLIKEINNLIKKPMSGYERILEFLIGSDKKEIPIKTLHNFFPTALASKIFIIVLKNIINK